MNGRRRDGNISTVTYYHNCPAYARSRLKHLGAQILRYPTELVRIEIKDLADMYWPLSAYEIRYRSSIFQASQKTTYSNPSAISILRINHRT